MAKVLRFALLPLLSLGMTNGVAAQNTGGAHYTIDRTQSQADADVRFFAFGKRVAHFPAMSGQLMLDRTGPDHILLDVVIDARQLRAGDAVTEARLKGQGFFDTAHYPTIHFRGERLTMRDGRNGTVSGALTARGVTRPVTLAVQFQAPPMTQSAGAPLALTATTRINRNDFAMRAYPIIVGAQVNITITARLIPQAG